MENQAPLVSKHFLPLDKEIALKYVTYLVEKRIADLPETRRDFCEQAGFHPKLLYSNPHLSEISRLFQDQSSIERLGGLTLREYLSYHRHYLQHGERHGARRQQQRWLGRELARSPFDCWVYQEILWETRPDFVVALGPPSGGCAAFLASILQLMERGELLAIESDATSPETVEKVRTLVAGKRVLVVADADLHPEKNHVLAQLRAYAPLVHVGGYFIAESSLNDVMDFGPLPDEGPKAAVHAFLAENDQFGIDRRWGERYVLTLNPDGFLLRVR